MAEMSAVDTLAHYVALDGMSRIEAIRRLTPDAIANNVGRIYDWMREVGLAAESDTREALFTYAAEQFGVDYDVFYDAWLEQRPANLEGGAS